MYYVYILRCNDNSLYTGITTDVERRLKEHCDGFRGAKYTKSRKPLKIEAVFEVNTKSDALKLEIQIKKLTKPKKESLVLSEWDICEISDMEVKRIYV